MSHIKKPDFLTRIISKITAFLGRPMLFTIVMVTTIVWCVASIFTSGIWKAGIDAVTIVTFLVVFVIQNAQNRANLANDIKLDAIMKKMGITQEDVLKAEEESDKTLESEKKSVQSNGKKKK